jgi:hypothetical protein
LPDAQAQDWIGTEIGSAPERLELRPLPMRTQALKMFLTPARLEFRPMVTFDQTVRASRPTRWPFHRFDLLLAILIFAMA